MYRVSDTVFRAATPGDFALQVEAVERFLGVESLRVYGRSTFQFVLL